MGEQLKDHCGDVTAPLRPGGEQRLSSQREELYRETFEDAPVAIWVEDWSRAKSMIDQLARRGVKNWRRYFERRPDQLIKANDLCGEIDVNAATLSIYGATSKEEIMESSEGASLTVGELKLFCDQIVAVAEGADHFVTEATETAMDDSEIFTRIHGVIPQGHRKTWSRVIFTIENLTERKRTEDALRESEARYRELFDNSPIGLWEEDWSSIKEMIDRLGKDGITDWRRYFRSHQDQLAQAYNMAREMYVNQAALDLYRAPNRQAAHGMNQSDQVRSEELPTFLDNLIAFIEGRTSYIIEAKERTYDDAEIVTRRHVVIPRGH
ncbi:MAG: PAS domain-containing protein [Alphaproteobacteria bacterium]